jgi:release factor glutamine methyltransferase
VRYTDLYHKSLELFTSRDQCEAEFQTRSLEIQILFEKAFDLSRERFWQVKNEAIKDTRSLRRFYRLRSRLAGGEPLAYILKEKEFYSTPLFVNRHVLIPRPETELLVRQAIAHIDRNTTVLDIGCGSGNISIAVALAAGCRVWACDVSAKALSVAKKNRDKHGLRERIIFERADLFPRSPRRFDRILSNPPYLTDREWVSLPRHIKDYEPKQALVAGPDGYECIERIISEAVHHLKPAGRLLLEIGWHQMKTVRSIFLRHRYAPPVFHRDYSGVPRVAEAQR